VIIGAAALLELELELLPLCVAAEAPEEVEAVFAVLPDGVDVIVDPVESVETVVDGAAEIVRRAPAVKVTSCPPRADPPSVNVVVVPVMVVVEPAISATPDPKQVPLNEDVIVQPNEIVLGRYQSLASLVGRAGLLSNTGILCYIAIVHSFWPLDKCQARLRQAARPTAVA
jgi:hypothetical protein